LDGQFFQITCATPKDIFLKTYYACQNVTETLEGTKHQIQKNDSKATCEWISHFAASELENSAWLALKEIQKGSKNADLVNNWMSINLISQYFAPAPLRNYDLISDIKSNPVSSVAVKTLASSLLGAPADCAIDTKEKPGELILFGLACEKMRTSLVEKSLVQKESALAHYLLGQIKLKLNDLKAAHEHLTKAEFIAPRNEFILFELAKLNLKNGKAYEAISFLEAAHDVNPSMEAIKLELIRLYSKVGLNDKTSSLMDEIKGPDANESISDVYLESGKNYIKDGDFEMAISLFDKAIESNPKNDKAHYELAQVYLYNKTNTAKAIEHLERYLALTPDEHDTQKIFTLITELKAKAGEK
jgi:tetratricopeptide (TPR) repeat protein